MQSHYTFIALDLARERADAERQRLLRQDALDRPDRSFRRTAASAIAALSRATGRIAQRLAENAAVPTH